MLKPSNKSAQANMPLKFNLRPTAKTLSDFSRSIAPGALLPVTFITVLLIGAGRFNPFRSLVLTLV